MRTVSKILIALAVPVMTVALYGRRMSRDARPDEAFFVSKFEKSADYDLVIAGDSRCFRGIDPETFERILPGIKTLNYGFSSVALDETYLNSACSKLKASGAKLLLVTISPTEFLKASEQQNDFIQTREMSPLERFNILHFEKPYYGLLDRGPHRKTAYFMVDHDDGWMESWKVPEHPREALADYHRRFQETAVDIELEENFLSNIRRLANSGIKVFGVIVPTSPEMRSLEEAESGFDYRSFPERFSRAGGIWVEIREDDFPSYDGSHLRRDGAKRFSEVLGLKLKAILFPQK